MLLQLSFGFSEFLLELQTAVIGRSVVFLVGWVVYQTAELFDELVGQCCHCLLACWVGDGWDGALAVCHGCSVQIQLVVADA